MKEEIWWSCPTEAENGRTVIVTGHDGLEGLRNKGKHHFRLEVSLKYEADKDGMPTPESEELLDAATEAFHAALKKDTAVVMTGIYTGDGQRDWVFYATSLFIFQKVFNRALESLEQMPLAIEAYEDPQWEEYEEMRTLTYIPDED
ncbi:MAG: DUF695 domain-containing protein [Muribaculaceae bacterium]|nr:DUF695 domain-containing protein [Muribaculaceae bacterium]